MSFPKLVPFSVLGGTGALDFYVPIPVRGVIRGVQAAVSADPGDGETVTATTLAGVALGVLTYGTDIAAGATGTYVANATTGGTVVAAGSVVKLAISALTAAATFVGYIEVDEFALTVQ